MVVVMLYETFNISAVSSSSNALMGKEYHEVPQKWIKFSHWGVIHMIFWEV